MNDGFARSLFHMRFRSKEAGKLELNPQTVQLAPLIDEVVGTARQLAEQNRNRLLNEVHEILGTLTIDPMRLRQVLLNLLSNACKFTKDGEVGLRVRRVSRGGHWIELSVSDTGIGMTSEHQARGKKLLPRPYIVNKGARTGPKGPQPLEGGSVPGERTK